MADASVATSPDTKQQALDSDSEEEILNAERPLLAGSAGPAEPAPANKPEKSLSIVSLVAMVFFLVCGGAYGTEDLGGAIPPLFALLGIIIIPWLFSLPIALMTAEMATAMTSKGGFIVWIRQGWGDFMSVLDACLVTFIVIMDQALYPLIYQGYVNALMPGLGKFEGYGFCVGFIVLGCIINLLGVGVVGHGSKVFSFLTLVPFIIFIILGFACGHFYPSRWFSTEGSWDISLYLSVLLWANCGYEYSGFVANEVRKPRRNYPRAMIGSVFLAMATYLFPITTAIATAPEGYVMSEGSYPELADNLGFGLWLRYLLTVGALASNFGTYIAYLATSSQSLHALALEGRLPFFMTLTLPRFNTPIVCILFYTLTTLMLALLDFSVIVETESVLYCVHVVILFTAFVRLRFVAPEMKRPYRVPGNNIVAIIVALLPTAVALVNIGVSGWLQWVICGSTIVLIAIIYFTYQGIKKCRERRQQSSTTESGAAQAPEATDVVF